MSRHAFHKYRATCASLFLLGWDTIRIAEYWGISEAEALRELSVERSIKLGLSVPYEARP